MDSKQFMKRFKAAKTLRMNWEKLLKDAYKYNLPDRQLDFNGSKQRGKDNTAAIWDDTSAQALQEFTNNLKQKLLPRGQKWAKIDVSGLVKAEVIKGLVDQADVENIRLSLDRNSDIMFEYINDSNFDSAVLEALQDMAISTGALLCLDGNNVNTPLNFQSVPSDQLVIEDGVNDNINVWRERSIKVEDIKVEYPDAELDDNLQRLLDRNPTASVNLVEGTIYNHEQDTFNFMVYCDKSKDKIIYKANYKVSPWIIFRWNKAAGEVWGRGQALQCLPTTKYLNSLRKDILKNNAMATNPPMLANPSLLATPNSIRIAPNSIVRTTAGWTGQQNPLQPLFNGSSVQTSVQSAQELRQQIRECFYLDVMSGAGNPVRSATEVSIANSRAIEQQMSAFSRLERELVAKVIRRVYYILSERYDILEKTGDIHLTNIKSVSPLAAGQAQQDISAITNFMGTVSQMFGEQAMPVLAASIKLDKLPNYLSEKFEVPPSLRMSAEESAQAMTAMQQAAQQMQQAQQLPQ